MPPQTARFRAPEPVVVQDVANPPQATQLPGPFPVLVHPVARPPHAAWFPGPKPVVTQVVAKAPHDATLPGPEPVVSHVVALAARAGETDNSVTSVSRIQNSVCNFCFMSILLNTVLFPRLPHYDLDIAVLSRLSMPTPRA